MKVRIWPVITVLLFSISCYSQVPDQDSLQPEWKKNVVYGTLGLGIKADDFWYLFGGNLNLNYERMLFGSPSLSCWFRIGGGSQFIYDTYVADSALEPYLISGLTLYNSKSRFELNAGAVAFLVSYAENDKPSLRPAGAIGYRRQKAAKGSVFRAGIGFPEIVYVSFGIAF